MPSSQIVTGFSAPTGFNASGIGRPLGRQGMHEFTETHVMAVPHLAGHAQVPQDESE